MTEENQSLVQKLLDEKQTYQSVIRQLEDMIRNLNKKIEDINEQIYELCKHNWIVCSDYCEHNTVYICSICRSRKY